jgi:hypothetical protein
MRLRMRWQQIVLPAARAAVLAANVASWASLRLVRTRIARIFHGIDVRGAVTHGLIALRRDEVIPGFHNGAYTTRPQQACGKRTVNESWVVLVALPRARMASLVPALIYVVRTRDGMTPWYLAYPNAQTGALLP